MTSRVLDEDVVRVRGDARETRTGETQRGGVLRMLYWGDPIDLVDEAENAKPSVRDVQVRIYDEKTGEIQEAFVRKRRENGINLPLRLRPPGADNLLGVTFVDVEHGDATLIRTPGGRCLLIDGAEESFITRLLHSAFGADPARTSRCSCWAPSRSLWVASRRSLPARRRWRTERRALHQPPVR